MYMHMHMYMHMIVHVHVSRGRPLPWSAVLAGFLNCVPDPESSVHSRGSGKISAIRRRERLATRGETAACPGNEEENAGRSVFGNALPVLMSQASKLSSFGFAPSREDGSTTEREIELASAESSTTSMRPPPNVQETPSTLAYWQSGRTRQDDPETSAHSGTAFVPAHAPRRKPPLCPARLVLFCVNLFLGLVLSQLIPEWISPSAYSTYKHVVKVVTMLHLSYIMINVGFEFELDKTRLRSYGKDYLVAMTAASFPWILVSLYFMFCLGEEHNVPWKQALVAGRFAAPTSAGILFTMLEAAGMKDTWLFRKARILAIFDDLDTLLLMVPLKGLLVGIVWELSIDLIWVVVLLFIMYRYLHRIDLPATWYWIVVYSAALTTFVEIVHWVTTDAAIDVEDIADTMHLEILLPAFTIGCVVKYPHGKPGGGMALSGASSLPERSSRPGSKRVLACQSTLVAKIKNLKQETFKFGVSAVFMVLVGLSMPSLFNEDAKPGAGAHRALQAAADLVGSGSSSSSSSGSASASGPSLAASASAPMPAGSLVLHVILCSVLMNVGKMFPAFCYREEANLRTRLALAIGMMPRGEVCAGIIVNAILNGWVTGASITIAVFCLAINMTCVSGFIFAVKTLSGGPPDPDGTVVGVAI
jgi:Kef-type K+ transport system membrane component KefB